MGTQEEEEIQASTTWAWKQVKIDPPPAAHADGRRRRPLRPALARWDGRTPLSVQVRYRGGAECWYEVKARGRTYRVPGTVGIHDVMEWIYGGCRTPE